jgi:hypothetical protein
VYDSYHTKPYEWATILDPKSQDTIRGTDYDAVMIALYVDKQVTRYSDQELKW